MFYFHGIMVGPTTFYNDYMAFITGRNFQVADSKKVNVLTHFLLNFVCDLCWFSRYDTIRYIRCCCMSIVLQQMNQSCLSVYCNWVSKSCFYFISQNDQEGGQDQKDPTDGLTVSVNKLFTLFFKTMLYRCSILSCY